MITKRMGRASEAPNMNVDYTTAPVIECAKWYTAVVRYRLPASELEKARRLLQHMENRRQKRPQ